jgi:hypothetical protein
MITVDDKCSSPKVGAPVMNGLHKTNQLTFVGHQLGAASGNRLAEEGQRLGTLMQHRTESRSRSITFDHKVSIEIRELKSKAVVSAC